MIGRRSPCLILGFVPCRIKKDDEEIIAFASVTLTIDDNPKEVRGKYFRIVGRLIADGVDISDLLIERHMAVPYDGGTKTKIWCE